MSNCPSCGKETADVDKDGRAIYRYCPLCAQVIRSARQIGKQNINKIILKYQLTKRHRR